MVRGRDKTLVLQSTQLLCFHPGTTPIISRRGGRMEIMRGGRRDSMTGGRRDIMKGGSKNSIRSEMSDSMRCG